MDFLVIDDDKTFRDATSFLIEGEGHYAEGAPDGTQALATLNEEKFDAVLLDVNLQNENGLDVLSEILKIRPGLPVVMFTAEGSVKTAVEAMRRGAVDFLEKPFDHDKLIDAIDGALQQEEAALRERQRRDAAGQLLQALTQREREVMALVVAGKHNREIGPMLAISVRTVEVHKARLMAKLGATNVADLVRMSMER